MCRESASCFLAMASEASYRAGAAGMAGDGDIVEEEANSICASSSLLVFSFERLGCPAWIVRLKWLQTGLNQLHGDVGCPAVCIVPSLLGV